MLGQFLEVSVAVRPLSAAFEFYRALGFLTVPVGDVLSEPYIAFFDGRVAVGLHERDTPTPALTFVRPRLRDYVRPIRKLGIEIEDLHVADDEFNRIAFSDPNGQRVALLEARTFSHVEWSPLNVSACGEFLEYSLATDSIGRSRAFWEALGLAPIATGNSPHPWLRLQGHGLVLGLHEASVRAGLCFRVTQLAARIHYLEANGVAAKPGGPLADREQQGATFIAPDGTAIYLIETTS